MRREQRYDEPSRHQRFYAWVMLLVYLPIVLMSSVHVHPLQEHSQSVDCYQCHTGDHHPGHITTGTGQHDSCLSCRFLGTQVLVPDMQVVDDVNRCVVELELSPVIPSCALAVAHPSLRAPPVII